MTDRSSPEAARAPRTDVWAERTDYIRSTTKWLMGAIAGAVSLLLGTSPLTNIGSLDPGWRLMAAIGAGMVALAALGFAFSRAVRILEARLLDIDAIAEDADLAWLRNALDARLKRRFPHGIHDIAGLDARFFALREQVQDPHRPRPDQIGYTAGHAADDWEFATLRRSVAIVLAIAGFEMARHLFAAFRRALMVAVPVAAAALLVFAWAANPPKPADTNGQPPQDIRIGLASCGQGSFPIGVCCGVSAACRAPPRGKAPLPGDCSVLRVGHEGAVCLRRGEGPGGARGWDRVFVRLPARIDLAARIGDVVGGLARSGKPATTASLTTAVTRAILHEVAAEIGKDTADAWFGAAPGGAAGTADGGAPGGDIVIRFGAAPAIPAGDGLRSVTVDLYPFPPDRASIADPAAWRDRLEPIADAARRQACRIAISGFADRTGDAAHNLYLAMERASYVERLLLDLGLSRAQIAVRAAGSFTGACPTDGPGALACNRAVVATAVCRGPAMK